MKFSARNQLKGKVIEVMKERPPGMFVSTSEGVVSWPRGSRTNLFDELGPATSRTAYAIIKSQDSVMVAVD